MKEMHPWENDLRSWTPRRPSTRIARRLFGKAELAPVALRRAQLWLTPVAACVLTMLLAVGSINHRAQSLVSKDNPAFFAAMMLDPGSSNMQPMVWLSQMDENVQWNVCAQLTPPGKSRRDQSPSILEVRSAAATNLNR